MWEVNISHYLIFLSKLYYDGLSYFVLNSTRSALSSVFGKIDNCAIGEHKLIVDFMKGVSRLRPPRPRYDFTWNPDLVLKFLKGWTEFSLKIVTLKSIALLALCTGQRVQTLCSIKLNDIVWEETIQIRLSSILKTTIVNRSNPVLFVPPYHDKSLCPVTILKMYRDMTKSLRGNELQLFISFCKPHKAVTSQSVSRWLCEVLEKSGINVHTFHAHSFRHASVSKAAAKGVSVDTIFKRVGWTDNSKSFALYYNRPFEDPSEFGKIVMSI